MNTGVTGLEFKSDSKGFLPIGFIYFQLRGQPAPGTLFAGTWQNISSQFAGLFFRVEGGNAAQFEQNQDMMIQEHHHEYVASTANIAAGEGYGLARAYAVPGNTGSTGGIETRPVNTTIRIWKRVS